MEREGEQALTTTKEAELLNDNCEDVRESESKDPPQRLIREEESVSCASGE